MMLIDKDNIKLFAYTNEHLVKNIKGIVIEFYGLNGGRMMITEDDEAAVYFGKNDILYIIPYCGPWSWMNDATLILVDGVLRAIKEKYSLPDDIPVAASGGSMGGLASLVYAALTENKLVGCAANCPVCDLLYHYNEREDLPRTLLSAFGNPKSTLEEELKLHSPLYLIDKMPDIPYYIVHCKEDKSVNKKQHSDRFVSKLKGNHSVAYREVENAGHCQLDNSEKMLYYKFLVNTIL